MDHGSLTGRAGAACTVVLLACMGIGCATPLETAGLAAGVTAAGAHSPNNEVEQTYYLGVFDPQEQLEPSVYRVRVHGQASAISFTRFASGWIPAAAADSLGTTLRFNAKTGTEITRTDADDLLSELKTGRRLMIFGPEGFREAPADHRLAIVMGSSPEAYFRSIQTALGNSAQLIAERRNEGLRRDLFDALRAIREHDRRMDSLKTNLDAQFPAENGGGQ